MKFVTRREWSEAYSSVKEIERILVEHGVAYQPPGRRGGVRWVVETAIGTMAMMGYEVKVFVLGLIHKENFKP